MFANDGERDQHYLVAESFLLYDEDVEHLQQQQIAASLAQHGKTLIYRHKSSVLKNLAQNDDNRLRALIDRNPALTEDNVGYLIYRGNEYNRILLIYNLKRFVDFVQKRQLNPNASGEEGLLHKPAALAFHIDPQAREAWSTRLQGSIES